MEKFKDMFTEEQWNKICLEVQREIFDNDYANFVGGEGYKPQSDKEKEYFDKAYEEFRNIRDLDVSDEEAFMKTEEKMESKGWIAVKCSHCEKITITKVNKE